MLLLFGLRHNAAGYGVLTHQSLIDASWDEVIKPVLLERYPDATPEQLHEAHAYAYGGAVIHDMGYFPMGKRFYSDLVHYVRSGDFVEALLEEAQNLNEFAFAIGAMSHYYGDNYGHALATNVSVPIVYPRTLFEHGPVVTYADDPLTHMKMELGFDVLQVVRGQYPPGNYRNFIGFKVANDALARAFRKTYGLDLKKQFLSYRLTISIYRNIMKSIFPSLTRIAWQMKDIRSEEPPRSIRHLTADWDNERDEPSLREKLIAYILRYAPKVGPFSPLAFRQPTPETELLFNKSYEQTLLHFQEGVRALQKDRLRLRNTGLDTGEPVQPRSYPIVDETHGELLEKIGENRFKYLNQPLKEYLLTYYHDPILLQRGEQKDDAKERLRYWHELREKEPEG